jgi:GntR family transcriptional regulator, transcriptional repressor for pyruvate dehydrogenase complex
MPDRLEPLAPTLSRTAQLAERLGRDIRSGKLGAGERLPTEQELIAHFQVSRTVVREAMASLRAEGLIVSRQGAGVFVASNATGRPFRIISDELRSLVEVENVLQLRLAVEVEAAGIAAERRTKADLLAISHCLEMIDGAIARDETAVKEDLAFHCAISAATGNPYFERFMHFLGPVIIPRQTIRLGLETATERRAYIGQVQNEHHQIYAAVKKGDRDVARRCTREHLEAGRDRYRRLVALKPSQAFRPGSRDVSSST